MGGELGFLDEKWDEDQMGDIYGMLADQLGIMEEIKEEREGRFSPDNLYDVFICVIYCLVFVLPLAFLFVEMRRAPDENSSRLLSSDFEARIAALENVIAKFRE